MGGRGEVRCRAVVSRCSDSRACLYQRYNPTILVLLTTGRDNVPEGSRDRPCYVEYQRDNANATMRSVMF